MYVYGVIFTARFFFFELVPYFLFFFFLIFTTYRCEFPGKLLNCHECLKYGVLKITLHRTCNHVL